MGVIMSPIPKGQWSSSYFGTWIEQENYLPPCHLLLIKQLHKENIRYKLDVSLGQ